MADDVDVQVLESKAPQDVQDKAIAMGWIPPTRFKGDAEKFVDADVFVERGEHFVPILQDRARKAEAVAKLANDKADSLARALAESQESIAALQEYHTEETERQVKAVREKLTKEIKEARTSGDVDVELEAQSELNRLDAAEAAAKDKPAANGKDKEQQRQQQKVAESPDYPKWVEDNPWFGKDLRKTHLAMGIATEIRADINAGRREPLQDRAFFDLVTAEVDKTLGGAKPRRKEDSVESGRHSGSRTSGGGKSYNDMPQEAKDACASFEKDSRLVGPNRAHKDAASFRASYAKTYWKGEGA